MNPDEIPDLVDWQMQQQPPVWKVCRVCLAKWLAGAVNVCPECETVQ